MYPDKAIILISGGKVGGAEKRFARTYRHLSQDDPSFCLIIDSDLYEACLRHNIRLDLSPNVNILEPWGRLAFNHPVYKKLYFVKFARDCLSIVRNQKIRLVHLVLSGAYIGLPLLHLKGVVGIVSIVDQGLNTLASRFSRPIYRYILNKSKVIEALSEDIKTRLIGSDFNQKHKLDNKISVSPCSFIELEKFSPNAKKENWICFAGGFRQVKNPLLFVEALPKIISAAPEVKFFMLGKGELTQKIKARAKTLGISDKLTLTYTETPEKFLAKSKIFISLQTYNNYPSQSLLEAMACQNALVATDVGETWRLVDASTGVRVAANPDSVAAAAVYLLKNPEILKNMGAEARQKVLKEHRLEIFSKYLESLYDGVVKSRHSRESGNPS